MNNKLYGNLIFELSQPGRKGYSLPKNRFGDYAVPQELTRQQEACLPECDEMTVVRHYTNLSANNFGVDNGFYPLGSCTMKYNPKVNEEMAALPQFQNLHPLQPAATTRGADAVCTLLCKSLCELTGLHAFTLKPFAGAHGELTGLMVIRAYHEHNGDMQRTKVIVPDSAHGTNPASAAVCGLEVVEVISSYAMEFGYGQSLDIDLPTQAAGFVPTAQWKQKEKNVKWTDGDTINISIGQGDLLVTPLHVADMMAMVCNSGTIYKPHLLKEVRDPNTGDVIQEIEPEVLHQSTVDKSVWRTVQEYLRYMITDGSAQYPMANKKIKMAGKTGTAEAGYTDNHWHAWMVVYGPYDAPVEDQVVVATIVEAVNTWEWWAPYATNIVMQGIFENQTYEESIRELGFAYMDKKLQGGGAAQTTQATETVEVGRQE